jgi:phage-related protein
MRISTDREHRVIYVARKPGAIHVLHAFEKKSQRTTTHDLALARSKLRRSLPD